jgi:hypothetical protein
MGDVYVHSQPFAHFNTPMCLMTIYFIKSQTQFNTWCRATCVALRVIP